MRRHSFVPHVTLALALGLAAAATGRQQPAKPPQADEGGAVRGAFRKTRHPSSRAEKKDAAGQPAAAQRAKPAGAKDSGGPRVPDRQTESLAKVRQPSGASAAAAAAPTPAPSVREEKPTGIALGYTLFMRAPTGEAVRVGHGRKFKSGDSVRLLLETNMDGYLYVFNAENDADPLMIFPNAKLGRGANFVRAHVPYEIPSSAEQVEELRWLSFDDRPAVERVYLIVSRRPLEGVPAGEALVRLCAVTAPEACEWSPRPEQWAVIKKPALERQLATSRAADEGHAETPAEHEAATRGLGLPADAPLPSVIYMITSANSEILVATIDLIHR
jgi:hypothetical protein